MCFIRNKSVSSCQIKTKFLARFSNLNVSWRVIAPFGTLFRYLRYDRQCFEVVHPKEQILSIVLIASLLIIHDSYSLQLARKGTFFEFTKITKIPPRRVCTEKTSTVTHTFFGEFWSGSLSSWYLNKTQNFKRWSDQGDKPLKLKKVWNFPW